MNMSIHYIYHLSCFGVGFRLSRQANIHAQYHTYGQFRVTNQPSEHVLDCGKKLE